MTWRRRRPGAGSGGSRNAGDGAPAAERLRRPVVVPVPGPCCRGRTRPGAERRAQAALLPMGMVMGVVFPEEPLLRKSMARARMNWSSM